MKKKLKKITDWFETDAGTIAGNYGKAFLGAILIICTTPFVAIYFVIYMYYEIIKEIKR